MPSPSFLLDRLMRTESHAWTGSPQSKVFCHWAESAPSPGISLTRCGTGAVPLQCRSRTSCRCGGRRDAYCCATGRGLTGSPSGVVDP